MLGAEQWRMNFLSLKSEEYSIEFAAGTLNPVGLNQTKLALELMVLNGIGPSV